MDLERLKETVVLLDYEINNLSFKELIDHVLQRIPNKFEEEFLSFSIYEKPTEFGACVDEDKIFFDIGELEKKSKGDDAVKIGVIAHELAHVFLKHHTAPDDGIGGLKNEDEADRLASEWGFTKEVKAFRQKIPPTIENSNKKGKILRGI